jgi:hypothetical protein
MQDFLHGRLSCSPQSGTKTEGGPGFVGMAQTVPGASSLSHAHSAGGARAASSQEPDIQLIQENGQLKRIVVVCSCGERIELECAY